MFGGILEIKVEFIAISYCGFANLKLLYLALDH